MNSQEKVYEALGNAIFESAVANDTIAFKSLIVPEQFYVKMVKKLCETECTDEQLKQALTRVPEMYKGLVEGSFMMTFFSLTSKIQIFELNSKNITNYQVLESTDKIEKDMGIQRVIATIDHSKHKYFSFGMVEYNGQYYVVDQLISISETNPYEKRAFIETVKLSANKEGHLESKGTYRIDSETADADLFQCFLDNMIMVGVTETEISEDDSKVSFVKGTWEFPYRVNKTDDYIGLIEFSFEFSIENGVFQYRYYNYVHNKDDSEYQSLGILPFTYNEEVAKVFNKINFSEILYDIEFNLKIALIRFKEAVDACH
ncbi:hypothetical protein [uncultured Psychroserpens sp.]|uniref:hypothetical protein n=1 Tax=uncultured Psychroserpens sp. TaxID=255436 RepID=UPI00262E730D|nr:hypothetical protein [uncultured Psychroserpens sp.]